MERQYNEQKKREEIAKEADRILIQSWLHYYIHY